jgi:hypothetical protein
MMSNGNGRGQEQLLTLNHEIRTIEHQLGTARRRRRWSNLSLVLGSILGVVLYGMWWIPWIPRFVVGAVYVPAIPIVISFGIASVRLKRNPGGPAANVNGQKVRKSEGDLELELARKREARKHLMASADVPTRVRRVAYKEDAYSDIDKLRVESRRYRGVNNVLQGILIIGSLAATGAAGVAAELASVRWVILGVTFAVGISSGFMGYFKYKERSFYLQQTADAIEHEWEAVDIGVGRYKNSKNEDEALADFVEEVHRLKSEQKKRQQNLEQPPESRDPKE